MVERAFTDVAFGSTDPDDAPSDWLSEVVDLLDRVARCIRPSFRSLAPPNEPGFYTRPDLTEVAEFAMRDPDRGTGWDLEISRIRVELLTFNRYDEGYFWSFKAMATGLPEGRSVRANGHGGGKMDLFVEGEPYELRKIEQLVLDLLEN